MEHRELLTLLRKFKDLLYITNLMWNTSLVSFELKEGAQPVRLQPYPVPKLHEVIFKMEFERLV